MPTGTYKVKVDVNTDYVHYLKQIRIENTCYLEI